QPPRVVRDRRAVRRRRGLPRRHVHRPDRPRVDHPRQHALTCRATRVDQRALRKRAAIGAATRPPTPPPSTITANARLLRYPMNQARVSGGLPLPNSAVPVLPNVPAGSPAPAAVPL